MDIWQSLTIGSALFGFQSAQMVDFKR